MRLAGGSGRMRSLLFASFWRPPVCWAPGPPPPASKPVTVGEPSHITCMAAAYILSPLPRLTPCDSLGPAQTARHDLHLKISRGAASAAPTASISPGRRKATIEGAGGPAEMRLQWAGRCQSRCPGAFKPDLHSTLAPTPTLTRILESLA